MGVDISIREDERLDQLFNGRISVIQKKDGYRFSIDALLLAHFASVPPPRYAVDLGTGCGIIPLILARKAPFATIVGVEVQESLADMAERTIALNGHSHRVTILHNDLKKVPEYLTPASFDLVVSNPPYYPVSNGRVNPDYQKAIARHEVSARLDDVVCVSHYLAGAAGKIVIIFPASRLSALLHALTTRGIHPRRLHLIYSHQREEAKLVVVEAGRGGNPGLKVMEPFFVYGPGGEYSKQMQTVYDQI